MPPNEMGGESEQPASELQEQQDSPGEGSGDSQEQTPMPEADQSATAPLTDEPEVQTADALESNLQDLVEDEDGYENVYVEIPKVDLKYIIAKNDDIHKEMDAWFNYQQTKLECLFDKVDEEFIKFKRNAQKEVNYLVKEFECRKAADSYARATTARTGVLDTSKLHTYKYNEDLFKKVSVIPDGKNHGLIFVLDWSGSMSRVMLDTIKQLYNLIWFCKKVSIPFEVYAFTNEWKKPEINYETQEIVKPADWTCSYEKKENLLAVHEQFSLMNLLTSKTNGKQLEHQMINIWRCAKCFGNFYGSCYSVPTRLGLSGTPLNEAFVCLHQILPQFQKENKLQKVQCIVLTDGEANHLSRHVDGETSLGE